MYIVISLTVSNRCKVSKLAGTYLYHLINLNLKKPLNK